MRCHKTPEQAGHRIVLLVLTVTGSGQGIALTALPVPGDVVLIADRNPAYGGEMVTFTCQVPAGPPIQWIKIRENTTYSTEDRVTCYNDGSSDSGGVFDGSTFTTCQRSLSSGAHSVSVVATKSMELYYTCEIYYENPSNPIEGVVTGDRPLRLRVYDTVAKNTLIRESTVDGVATLNCSSQIDSYPEALFKWSATENSYLSASPTLQMPYPWQGFLLAMFVVLSSVFTISVTAVAVYCYSQRFGKCRCSIESEKCCRLRMSSQNRRPSPQDGRGDGSSGGDGGRTYETLGEGARLTEHEYSQLKVATPPLCEDHYAALNEKTKCEDHVYELLQVGNQ